MIQRIKEWDMWKPQPWEWKFPEANLQRDSLGNPKTITVTEELHKQACDSMADWYRRNPAPWWWKVWCRLFNRDTHRPTTELGVMYGAVPRVLDGQYLKIVGNIANDPRLPMLRGTMITAGRNSALFVGAEP